MSLPQGTITVNCPAMVMEMTPPQVHMHLELSLSAGILPISTVGQPGTQGATVTGTQGAGVGTPKAAAVAAATVGFDGVVHMANGGILATGLKSMMVAAITPPAMTGGPDGMTTSEEGAAPKEHVIMAPMTTCKPIASLLAAPN
jgi:hypothetical protein